MPSSLYQFTSPIFVKALRALDGILTKAEQYAREQNLEEASLLEERLAPDMFPLKKQIQVACDNAKGAVARLSGIEAPVHTDNETTFAELHARLQKTLEFLATVSEETFQGADTRHITLPYFPGKYMTGFEYVREYALPNFFFHVTMTYAILRRHGLNLGKADYIGGLPLKDLSSL